MSIQVIKPGITATLQGAVRTGYRHAGIGGGGAMDSFAMQAANYMVANTADAAVIEINFPAPELLFLENALICIAGADFLPYINDQPVKSWRLLFVKKNTILQFRKPVAGTRAYIAVSGGWKAESWLNSFSTHLKANAGGFQGRALQKDDIVEYNKPVFESVETKILPWYIADNELEKIYQPATIIRCIKSVEWDWLDASSKNKFENTSFTLTDQSDRMGYRLNSSIFSKKIDTELLSSATGMGTIQLLPDGNCIILMADHQTTGGYPRIASVIKADLPKTAQLKPGNEFHFKLISLEEAEQEWLKQYQLLRAIQTACEFNFKNILQ